MSESVSTPRISSPYLDSHVGRNVIIVGKVTQLRGEIAVLDADGNVTVNLDRDAHLISGNGAQVIGKVNPDLTVKVLTSKDLGPDVDYSLVKSVVEATQQHRSLFVFDN